MFQTSLELWRREQDRGTIKAEVVSRPQPTMVSPYTLLPGTTWRNSNNLEVAELLLQNKLFPASISNMLANTFRRESYASSLTFPMHTYFKYFDPNSQRFSASASKESQLNAAFAIVGSCNVCK